jgi:UDP-GlcNAc:undecaprenyl-phosphate/decaprenyl-phosphate GlcNAc-1-phosphate transferase
MTNWYLIHAYALGSSFALSLILTAVVRKLAIRFNVLDHPGERKMQQAPVPLLGGVAIWVTFYTVIAVNLLALLLLRDSGYAWLEGNVLSFLGKGAAVRWKLVGIFTGGVIIFAAGVIDDVRALKPEAKLACQVAAALVLVLSGIRFDLFNPHTVVAGLFTMAWVVLITNAMNLLDNMDGLSPGVSVIAALSFFLCMAPTGQTFVCVLLMVFAGAVAGFLFHNFNPARIYMGDAGSMFCGYILATVAILGTYYTKGSSSRMALAAPLVALSVPLFDTASVIYTRWRRGESIMKGDKRHFSHRLVEIGMTPSQAVEFIYLVAAVAGLGAALLPHVGLMGTVIVLAQVVGLFCLIVLLMRAANGGNKGGDAHQ